MVCTRCLWQGGHRTGQGGRRARTGDVLVARDRAVVDAVLVAPGEGVREGLGLHVLVRQRAVCVEVGVLWACCERVVTLCESMRAIMMNTLRSSKQVRRPSCALSAHTCSVAHAIAAPTRGWSGGQATTPLTQRNGVRDACGARTPMHTQTHTDTRITRQEMGSGGGGAVTQDAFHKSQYNKQ
jgi:hypothetical protein